MSAAVTQNVRGVIYNYGGVRSRRSSPGSHVLRCCRHLRSAADGCRGGPV